MSLWSSFSQEKFSFQAKKHTFAYTLFIYIGYTVMSDNTQQQDKTFRPMRRIRQQLPEEEAVDILKRASSGVLSVIGDNGYPYGVPLSHVYHDGHLYFHTALRGHKIDALRACGKASFTVIDKDEVHPELYTTFFRSVICFGTVRVIDGEEEKMAALRMLGRHFAPASVFGGESEEEEALRKEIRKGFKALLMLDFTIEHVTGKQAKELVRKG